MTLQQIILLGFVQGLTEFLPVSSSGHLILMPHIFGWKDQGLFVDVALHVGTLFAVLTYFHKDAWNMITGFFSLLRGRMTAGGTLFLQLSIATIPAVIVGLSLRLFHIPYRSMTVVAINIIVFGAVLYLVDHFRPLRKTFSQMTYLTAFFFGIAQAFALIPGTSRSGACLIAGRLFSFKRPDAARFAFLMSIPAILAAAVQQTFEVWQKGASIIIRMSFCVWFFPCFLVSWPLRL